MQNFPNDLMLETVDLRSQPLADFDNRLLLVVNTASECGFTGQYHELEQFSKMYVGKLSDFVYHKIEAQGGPAIED